MKKYNKAVIGLSSAILLCLIPLMLNSFIFDNSYLSNVSNDGWASFLGSYIGGTIGGIGTLLAMYITLEHTQKQLMDSDKKDKINERKKEVNEIVDLVAVYLSDIGVYYDNKRNYIDKRKKLEGEENVYKELLQIWQSFYVNENIVYTDYLYKLNEKGIDINYPKEFFERRENKFFEQNRTNIFKEYEDCLCGKIREYKKIGEDLEYSFRKIREERIVGCQSLWILEIKLNGIQEGKELWDLIMELYKIANMECIDVKEQIDNMDIENKMRQIKEKTYSFSKLYVNSEYKAMKKDQSKTGVNSP